MSVVFASQSASVAFEGAQVPVRKGSHWPADDPLVKLYPHLFSADERYGMQFTREPAGYDLPPGVVPPVETATAAPGERRSTRRG